MSSVSHAITYTQGSLLTNVVIENGLGWQSADMPSEAMTTIAKVGNASNIFEQRLTWRRQYSPMKSFTWLYWP